jgi:hypothetical protein
MFKFLIEDKMEEHIFNGFRYFSNYGKEELPKIEHGIQIPEYLFKFCSFRNYSIDSLINNYLYASHPYELNDILDSSRLLFFTSKPIEFTAYEKLYFGERKVFKTEEELIRFYEDDIKNNCGEYLSHLFAMYFDFFGVISLSEKEDNILMWPHYTQEKGFQIKLKSKLLMNSISDMLNSNDRLVGLFPINYAPKIPPIDVFRFRRFDIPLIYSSNVKLDNWDYEKEWRLLLSKPKMGVPFRKLGFSNLENQNFIPENRYIKYGIDAIDSLCLGMNFFSGSDFYIHWKGEREIEVEPRKEENHYGWYMQFLNFIVETFYGKVYLSGIKYEMDFNGIPYLIRTKERVEITKLQESKYLIERTEEIIRFK